MKQIGEKEARVLERIKARMEEVGMTQQSLAKKLHMEQYQISKMLQGSPRLSIDTLEEIAKALDTNLGYLLHIRQTTMRELKKEDRELLKAYDQADPSTKTVVRRILGL